MSAEPATPHQLVVFSLGEEEYALPIEDVHEIIRYTEPRSVASAAGWIQGVISLRGRIVPVYDLAARLECRVRGAQADEVDTRKIVIAQVASEVAGIVVDDVREVLTVAPEQIESVGDDAIAKVGDRLIVMLSAAALFGHAEVPAAA
jgi:purine-binding chemotaxis protein CheW